MNIEQNNNMVRDANYSEDEISLYDLYRVLCKRKTLIALVFAVVIVLCVIYLLIAPKVYQVTATLLPPAQSELYLTNIEVSAELNYKPENIFNLYSQEVVSNENWNKFIHEKKNLFPKLGRNEQMQNPLKLDNNKDFPGEHATIKFATTERDKAAEIVQQYLLFAKQNLIKVLTQQITSYMSHNTKALATEIQFERETARQSRMDKMARLQSDLAIAKKLGIEENLFFNLAGKASDNKTGVFNVFTGNTSIPTYLRGVKVLSAELDSLKNRQSDDPYIPSLRKKQDQLLRLQKVQLTPDVFEPFRLNGEIDKPQHPVKPKKVLVLVLGGVLGLFLGVFSAFIAEFLSKAREQAAA